jgi:acyl-CoA synthetase (AMP-forming)/AMP-acid ligase II
LVVRGPHVMRGYWRDPEETDRKVRPGPRVGERVLYTGDLCRFDDEGYLYFVSRMDDIIKSRGEKVAPKEVEMAIEAIAGVKEAAVVGIADQVLGEAVHAFVVLEADAALDASDLLRACRERLESFMVPAKLAVMPALPKNSNGKIDRPKLRSDLQIDRL